MPVFYKSCITLLGVLFIGASIFRTMGWYIHDIYWAQEYLGGDKAIHVVAGMLIMHTIQLWLNSPMVVRRLWCTTLFVGIGLGIEEFSQRLLSSRAFSFEDLMASLGGVFIVVLFSAWYLWLSPQIPNRTLK